MNFWIKLPKVGSLSFNRHTVKPVPRDCPMKGENSWLREMQLCTPAHHLLTGSSIPNLRLPYRALNYGLLDGINAFA